MADRVDVVVFVFRLGRGRRNVWPGLATAAAMPRARYARGLRMMRRLLGLTEAMMRPSRACCQDVRAHA